ncbi:MAG TPA: beta-ketoacyl synthase N-terminal-like domain-containing protein, partial [Bryobacteraceae bacterium]|nr:beta-ketoacyl synthase N-terminal-like domain-containing protein [Bryobacteraceae bacterium]
MRNEPIAIVGMSALFPGSQDEAGFWRDIVAGKDLITDVPAHRWLIEDHYDPDPRAEDKTYCKRGAFLPHFSFDPLEFGVPPNAIAATDTCQLLSLLAAKRVLEDVARGQRSEIDRERASVILGVTSGQQLFLEVASRQRRPVWVKA